MKGLLADYLIKAHYGIDPDIMHKLYKCKKIMDDNNIVEPIDSLLLTINNLLKLQFKTPNTSYHKNNRLLLLVDEICERISIAIKFNNHDQVKLFLKGELSLYNLGKTSVENHMVTFSQCISCGSELSYNSISKKYSCGTCYSEYQS